MSEIVKPRSQHSQSTIAQDKSPIRSVVIDKDVLNESEESDDFNLQDIELLVRNGIHTDVIEKLKAAGVNTIKDVDMTTTRELLKIKGFNGDVVERIKVACRQYELDDPFITATKLCDIRKQIFKLSTGSTNLDKILGGGVAAMSITQVFGECGGGKTQLSHTLSVTAQMPGPNGYMGGNVIYIDTENTFRPDRVKAIAQRFNLDEGTALDNILYARVYNSEEQYRLLNKVAAKLHEAPGLFKLLIIDSVMALFRVDFTGTADIASRQQRLGKMLSLLQKISEEYRVAVFVTNQIMSDMRSTMLDEPKATGGNIMAHLTTTRLLLTKVVGDNRKRVAKLMDSPDLAQNEAEIVVTSGGIDDPVD